MAKMLRIIRTYTTVTDVDLSAYFDVDPQWDYVAEQGPKRKRQWTAEEAIAYERSREQYDQDEAFKLALENGEHVERRLSFDIITDVSQLVTDERTDTEREADEQAAVARHKTPMAGFPGGTQNLYEENARAGLLGT